MEEPRPGEEKRRMADDPAWPSPVQAALQLVQLLV